jgi:hypothetical protein
MIKVFYEWGRRTLRRIEIFTADLDRKPKFKQSRLAEIHQRILDKRKKK